MEQAQEYLMWMKRKQMLTSFLQTSMNSIRDSWEEKAFAEDASGLLGGCIWPPRCYACSFCRREFRSAQALGGHMNVHRRDRARLKQSLSPQEDDFQRHNHEPSTPSKSLEPQNNLPFDQLGSLDFELDPNSAGSSVVALSSLSSSRVSALSGRQNLGDHSYLSPCDCPVRQEQRKRSSHTYNLLGSSDCVALELFNIPDSKLEKGIGRKHDPHDICNGTSLLMGMKSVSSQNPLIDSCSDEAISCKRPKTSAGSTLSSIMPCSGARCALQSEETRPNSSSMEDIDLELRLGEPPRVK
ncbi:hypothetical protein K2173_020576 [Erythroxylum novogranatense]|uniref:C2H2-type domain-containing protein n=1 Tax=Erythroxylum novogranatense TaxID=1862640 RepID=A0AAV8TGZ9_9ROSI|nr:hypothetical protein K2173_020576 [Erythroxylum novogranatense]